MDAAAQTASYLAHKQKIMTNIVNLDVVTLHILNKYRRKSRQYFKSLIFSFSISAPTEINNKLVIINILLM